MAMRLLRITIVFTCGEDVMMSKALAIKCGDSMDHEVFGSWSRQLATSLQVVMDIP